MKKLQMIYTTNWCILVAFLMLMPYGVCNDELIVATLSKYPYTASRGHAGPDGLCVDLVEVSAKNEGIDIEFVSATADELTEQLATAQIDCIPFITDTQQNRNKFDLSAVTFYITNAQLLSYNNDNRITLESCNNRDIGFLVDDISAKAYVELIDAIGVNINPVWFDSIYELFQAIGSDKIFGGVISQYILNVNNYDNYYIASTDPYLPSVRVTMGFTKGKYGRINRKLSNNIESMKNCPTSEYFKLIDEYGIDINIAAHSDSWNYDSLHITTFAILLVLLVLLVGGLIYLYKKHVLESLGDSEYIHERETLFHFYKNLTVPLLVHRVDPENSRYFLVANPAAKELFGEELTGVTFDDVFAMVDSNETIGGFIQNLVHDKSVSYNVQLRKDKEYKNKFEFTTQIMPSGDRAFTFIDNYTDEVELLSNLKDSQYALEMATEAGRVGVFEFDVSTHIITGNKQVFINLGLDYMEDGLLLDDFNKRVTFDDHVQAKALFDGMVTGELEDCSIEFAVNHEDGLSAWMRLSVKTKNRDSSGRSRILVGVIVDIDQFKKMNIKLEAYSRNFDLLMDNSFDDIFSKDVDHNFIWGSSSIAISSGMSNRSELVGKNDFDFHEERYAKLFYDNEEKVLRDGKSVINHEEHYSNADGSDKWVLTTKVPIKDSKENIIGLIGIGRDITKYKKIIDELSKAQRIETVGTLAGGIAHEFNNLLNGVMGFTDLLVDRAEPGSKDADYLFYIAKGTQRCVDLTRHLLAFARRGKYSVDIIDLRNLIKSTIEELELNTKNDCQIIINNNAYNYMINADKQQIENVILNLLENAITAIHDKGTIVIETNNIVNEDMLDINGDDKSIAVCNAIEIKIIDDGEGISPENKEKIFEPFFTTRKVGEGAGLGLSAAFGIISNHNGSIHVESELGQGCCVTVILPLIKK